MVFFAVQWASGLGVLSWPLRVHLRQDLFGPLSAHLLAIYRPEIVNPESAYGQAFDALESVHVKSLVILMVPARGDRRPQDLASVRCRTDASAI